MSAKTTTVRNTSTNRVVLGGGRGVRPIILGGSDDLGADKAPSLSAQTDVDRVARFRKGPMGDLAQRLGVQFS